MNKQTVRDIDVKGRRVLVRVDYNVPLRDGQVGDDLRIKASLETLKYLLSRGCSLVLVSHLGRPKNGPDPKLSLAPVAKRLGELLEQPVTFAPDCVGSAAEAAVKALIPGGVLLLENLRFHSEEEANDPEFARALAAYGELFVDDAFAAVHRAHASTVGVTKYLPSVAGLLVEREVDYIQGALDRPDRPLVAIIGGAKVSDKIEVLNNLLDKADVLMIGGAMANTFFLAQGRQVGKSIAEPELAGTARNLLAQAERDGKLLVLPTEVVVSDSLERPEHLATVAVDSIRPEQAIIDEPGSFALQLPDLIGSFLDFTGGATVIWNGPLGIIEIPEFATGSRLLAEQIVALPGATSIIGGGDTASLVDQLGMHDKFTWVSTGGGASLELMAGKDLPGLAALRDK